VAIHALSRNVGMSAKKVRRVLGLVRKRKAEEALAMLRLMPSPVAGAVAKTLQSAIANAENNSMMAAEELRVVEAYANDAPMVKRFRPKSRGRINPIQRRSCHITITVDEEGLTSGA